MFRGVLSTIQGLVWAVILVLVGGRFLALLFGANADSELVSRLYRHSDFWVKPFFGMFDLTNKAVEDTGGVFEPASFLTFIVYVLAGFAVAAILSATYMPFSHRHRETIHEA